MQHNGTQQVHTQRLLLRPFVCRDCEDMLRNWIADPQVQSAYGEPVYQTEAEVAQLLKKWIDQYTLQDFYRWAITEKRSGANIGQIAFCRVYSDIAVAEIEYCIGRDFQGRGYAGEALAAILQYTFENTGFEKLEAFHCRHNEKSGRVLEKSVMRRTHTVQRFLLAGQTPGDEICYGITREEYFDSLGK